MRVLLTGAFGNIGASAVEALLERGHHVRCFDLDTPRNRAAAAAYKLRKEGARVEAVFGDLRRPEDVAAAVQGQEVVIHLAFLVPKLSAMGIGSEEEPDIAWAVNVDGTHNLLNAMRAVEPRPRIIFISSYHVYGPTETLPPGRTASDPVNPVEHYARHKVACEWLVKASGLEWAILRFAAAMPYSITLDPFMFQVPLANRMEYLHTKDAGVAVANAVTCPEVWGKTLLIGGGERCRLLYGQIVEQILNAVGVGMLPAEAFGTTPFATDWMDTEESERLLHYQQRTLDDFCRELRHKLGARVLGAKMFRPIVRRKLLEQSPYWRAYRAARREGRAAGQRQGRLRHLRPQPEPARNGKR